MRWSSEQAFKNKHAVVFFSGRHLWLGCSLFYTWVWAQMKVLELVLVKNPSARDDSRAPLIFRLKRTPPSLVVIYDQFKKCSCSAMQVHFSSESPLERGLQRRFASHYISCKRVEFTNPLGLGNLTRARQVPRLTSKWVGEPDQGMFILYWEMWRCAAYSRVGRSVPSDFTPMVTVFLEGGGGDVRIRRRKGKDRRGP